MWRHGDVLIDKAKVPKAAVARPRPILAEGELTGHAHRIADPRTAVLLEHDGTRYLRVTAKTATVVHEEHAPIELPRGEYRVWRQREYTPQVIRIVRD